LELGDERFDVVVVVGALSRLSLYPVDGDKEISAARWKNATRTEKRPCADSCILHESS